MQKLQEQGWYLSEQGYDLASDAGCINDLQKIIKRAVDMDLREIGNGQGDITNGNLVLQIQKLRNIAAPKYNEESRTAPRMLKLSLTDGKNSYQAVEIEHISGLGLNTPPGTKVLLKSGNILLSHGIVLLSSKNIARVLGGKVPNLVEKWELNRKLATHSRLRSVEEGGPPPWIPFGKKIIKGGAEKDKNFKALGKDSDKETTEFEAQRQDAIAEAARLGGKKIFGGGNKQLLDHSVQRIVDQGFTVEQAEYALKISRNHVERALKSLQRTNDSRSTAVREPREIREPRGKRFEKKTEETKPSTGKVSLFDFLEDKLPAQSDVPETQSNFQQQYQRSNLNENSHIQRLENQFERLELRGSDYSQAGKGGRAQRGGRVYPAPPRYANDESKYPKRSSHESHNSFSASNTFGNPHQARPPRFQRNQDFHGNQHPENVFKSNNSKPQGNERKNMSTTCGQSRGEFGVFNSVDSSTYTNKNHRSHGEVAKNQQYSDSRYKQPIDTEPKNKHVSGYDTSHGRYNRAQQETPHKIHSGAPNAVDKNYKNQSNRPHHSVATNELYKTNHGNNRNPDHESAGGNWVWKLGDDCMAKYWEDNRYYNAQVTAISATTCVVRFKDFNNHEEVLQVDCIPITDKPQEYSQPEPSTRRNDQRGYGNRQNRNDHGENHISGMEFRRSGGGEGGNRGSKGYNRKRGQQRSAQPIYQPPAQRAHPSSTWTAHDNPPV